VTPPLGAAEMAALALQLLALAAVVDAARRLVACWLPDLAGGERAAALPVVLV